MHCIIQIVSLEKVRQKILRKAFPGKVFLNLVQIIRIPNRGHWWNFSWYLPVFNKMEITSFQIFKFTFNHSWWKICISL